MFITLRIIRLFMSITLVVETNILNVKKWAVYNSNSDLYIFSLSIELSSGDNLYLFIYQQKKLIPLLSLLFNLKQMISLLFIKATSLLYIGPCSNFSLSLLQETFQIFNCFNYFFRRTPIDIVFATCSKYYYENITFILKS